MSIRTGTFCDPPELPGLAHLCEHMLFLGTEAYPEEGAYNKFVSQNGGHSNAYTEDGATCYYFDVSNAAFDEALRMFLHFFVDPLFTADSLEREVNAVHSEDEKNHSVDYWCAAEIKKLHLCNKQHPASRYGNGNRSTLWDQPAKQGIDVRARLLEFFKKYYVANNATLVVYTPLDSASVLRVAEEILGAMPPGPRTDLTFGVPPLVIARDETDARLADGHAIYPGTWVQMKTNRPVQRLSIEFPIPFSIRDYESKPAAYASHVIGHECEGSLLAVLKAEGLAENLSAGAGSGIDEAYDRFSINVGLTRLGVSRVQDVVALCFEAVAHMKRDGVVEWVMEEMEQQHLIEFNLSEIEDVHRYCASAARNANRYGLARALSGSAKVFRRDARAAAEVFDHLHPANAVFFLELQDVDGAIAAGEKLAAGESTDAALALPVLVLPATATRTALVSQHHSAHFGVGRVDSATLSGWADPKALHPKLATPKRNPFLATRFDVAPLSEQKYPDCEERPKGRFLWKKDSRFGAPKAFLAIALNSPKAYDTPMHRFYVRVTALLIEHVLTETLYFAELGAMQCRVVPRTNGIELHCTGAADKLVRLADHVLATVLDTKAYTNSQTDYDVCARRVIRTLLAHYAGQPYSDALERYQRWSFAKFWGPTAVLNAAIGPHVDDVEAASRTAQPPPFDAFKAFVDDELFATVRYEGMWVGNSLDDAAVEARDVIERHLASVATCPASALADQEEIVQHPSRSDLLATPASSPGLGTAAPLFGLVMHDRTSNAKDPNDAVVVGIQVGTRTLRARVLADCTMALINSLFFDTLRTTETLGYIVGSGSRIFHQSVALTFIVQSASFGAQYLLTRVHGFLEAIADHIAAVDASDVAQVIAAQRASRLDEPKTFADEGEAHWARMNNPYGLAYRELEAAELENVTKDDIVSFAQQHLALDSFDARCFCVALFHEQSSLDAFRAHTDRTGLRDLEPLIVRLLPKSTPTTGKEAIALPTYDDDPPRHVKLVHVEDRDAFVDCQPRVPPPAPAS